MRGHGKGQADVHPARIALDRRVEERSTSAKATISSNLRLISARLIPRMAPLGRCSLGPSTPVKAGSDLEQARHRPLMRFPAWVP